MTIRTLKWLQIAGVALILVGVVWRIGGGYAFAPWLTVLLGVAFYTVGRLWLWLKHDRP